MIQQERELRYSEDCRVSVGFLSSPNEDAYSGRNDRQNVYFRDNDGEDGNNAENKQ